MGILTTALAETAELSTVLEGATNEEAAIAGGVVGAILGVSAAIIIVWVVLQIIADWKIFTKAGEAGWKSIIPVYNYYTEYSLCWKGSIGLIFAAAYYIINLITSGKSVPNWQFILLIIVSIVAVVLHFMESRKLAKAFGKGTGFGVFLFLLGPIARLVLGFGSAQYQGNPER